MGNRHGFVIGWRLMTIAKQLRSSPHKTQVSFKA